MLAQKNDFFEKEIEGASEQKNLEARIATPDPHPESYTLKFLEINVLTPIKQQNTKNAK